MSERSGHRRRNGYYGLTAMAADYIGGGWPDIYVASDSTPSLLFRNQHDGAMKRSGLELGVAVNEDGREQAGMGLALGDYNLDGQSGYVEDSLQRGHVHSLKNDGKGGFDDVTMRSGLGVETRYVGWGAGIQDFDNDGLPGHFLGNRQRLSGGGKGPSGLPLQDAAEFCSAIWEAESSKSDRIWRVRRWPRRTPAAASPSEISITMATSIFSS